MHDEAFGVSKGAGPGGYLCPRVGAGSSASPLSHPHPLQGFIVHRELG